LRQCRLESFNASRSFLITNGPDSHMKYPIPILADAFAFMGKLRQQGMSFFFSGNERTVKVKKNIALLGIMKVVGILSGLFIVPLTLNYLTPIEYGVWLTLSSIVGWIVYFDVGLGNGLRNRFAEALAAGNTHLARIYVSTTYFLVFLIVSCGLIFFLGINHFLDWQKILRADSIPFRDLNFLVVIVVISFCMRFIFSLIGTVLTADQEPGRAGLMEVSINLVSLAAVFCLTKFTASSLLTFGVVLSSIVVLVPALASVWFYFGTYRTVAPSIHLIQFKYAKPLANIGVQFFIIQITALIVFSTSNILIANFLGPAEVTAYNVAFKYFSVVSMIFGIMVAPFWSAFTEAFHKKEFEWIKSSTRKLIVMWSLATVVTVLMLILSQPIYHLWIGNKVAVPFALSVAMACYVTISNWNSIFVSFLNGTGRIRLQLYSSIVIGLLNIPLAYVLVKYFQWGSAGVVAATCICLCIGSIWAPIQYNKLINNTATGIWAKQ
jgi:O-antigen/teichoic acid export membrane protein